MTTIFKYQLGSRVTTVMAPRGAKALSVGLQDDVIVVWMLVDERKPQCNRAFLIVGTGHDLDFDLARFAYVGTVQTPERYVWHVFDGGEER